MKTPSLIAQLVVRHCVREKDTQVGARQSTVVAAQREGTRANRNQNNCSIG